MHRGSEYVGPGNGRLQSCLNDTVGTELWWHVPRLTMEQWWERKGGGGAEARGARSNQGFGSQQTSGELLALLRETEALLEAESRRHVEAEARWKGEQLEWLRTSSSAPQVEGFGGDEAVNRGFTADSFHIQHSVHFKQVTKCAMNLPIRMPILMHPSLTI
jgi:hypothetical protein